MFIKEFENASEVFFTSDLHFKHGRIIQYCNRPFESSQEMTEKLIENWNKIVPDYAHVFILGDFAFANKNQWKSLLSRLTGHKYLILGNHDRDDEIYYEGFEAVADLGKISIKISDGNWRTFILSHRPFLCWEGSEKGTVMLSGHIHSCPVREETCTNGDIKLWQVLNNYPCWDVGIDNNDYRPINTLEVLEKIENKLKDANSI